MAAAYATLRYVEEAGILAFCPTYLANALFAYMAVTSRETQSESAFFRHAILKTENLRWSSPQTRTNLARTKSTDVSPQRVLIASTRHARRESLS